MQGGTPFDLPLSEFPTLKPTVTDTANPERHIPVYYFHSLQQPYCPNPACKCHWMQQEVRKLLGNIVEGIYTLREAADLLEEKKREGEQ